MKKFAILLLCMLLIFSLSACELDSDTDAATEPSGSESSIPTTGTDPSLPQSPTESEPTAPGTAPSTPGTEPSAPDTQPTVPTSPSEPAPTPDPEPDFRDTFMSIHNAGKKYTFSVELDVFEVSFNSDAGTCTVLHKQRFRDEYLHLGEIYYPLNETMTSEYIYYYMGHLTPAPDGSFYYRFEEQYMSFPTENLSKSTVNAVRQFVWDHIQTEWNDYYLTQAECELWDGLLDGRVLKDIRRFPSFLTISGNTAMPFELMYHYYDGTQTTGITVTAQSITNTNYAYAGAFIATEYSYEGKLLSIYEWHSKDSYEIIKYNSNEQRYYEIQYFDAGHYKETNYEYGNGICTATRQEYQTDKVDGLCCIKRIIDVYRYYPDQSETLSISSHQYDKDGKLVKYYLYNEAGKLTESMLINDLGLETRTVNTYEDDLLVKSVISVSDGTVTTQEYLYENGKLSAILVTSVAPNGDVSTWEEPLPAAPSPAPSNS